MGTEDLKHLCGIHLEEARLRKKNITTVSIVTSIILIVCVSLLSNVESTSKHLAGDLSKVYSQLGKELYNIPKDLRDRLSMANLEILEDRKLCSELLKSIKRFFSLSEKNMGEEYDENIKIEKLLNRRNLLRGSHVAISQLQEDIEILDEFYDLYGDKKIHFFYSISETNMEHSPGNTVEHIRSRYLYSDRDSDDIESKKGFGNSKIRSYIQIILNPLIKARDENKPIIDEYNKIYELLGRSNGLKLHPISVLTKDYSSILPNISKLARLLGVSVEEKYYKKVDDIPRPEYTKLFVVIRGMKEDARKTIAELKEGSKVTTKIYGFSISLSVDYLIFIFPAVFSLYIPMIYMMVAQYHIHLNTGAAFEKKILSNTPDNNIDPEILWQVKGKEKGFGNWLSYPGRLQQTLFQLFIGTMMIYIIYRSSLVIETLYSFFYLMVYVGIITTSFGVIAWLTIIILRKRIPEPIYLSPAGVQSKTDKT